MKNLCKHFHRQSADGSEKASRVVVLLLEDVNLDLKISDDSLDVAVCLASIFRIQVPQGRHPLLNSYNLVVKIIHSRAEFCSCFLTVHFESGEDERNFLLKGGDLRSALKDFSACLVALRVGRDMEWVWAFVG